MIIIYHIIIIKLSRCILCFYLTSEEVKYLLVDIDNFNPTGYHSEVPFHGFESWVEVDESRILLANFKDVKFKSIRFFNFISKNIYKFFLLRYRFNSSFLMRNHSRQKQTSCRNILPTSSFIAKAKFFNLSGIILMVTFPAHHTETRLN